MRIYVSDFILDIGATNSFAPAKYLKKAGIEPIGNMAYELGDGSLAEYPFAITVIEFMGEITCGRVIFGPDDARPRLGGIALASVGIAVDSANQKMTRLPTISLK
jgi:hypothetical protein